MECERNVRGCLPSRINSGDVESGKKKVEKERRRWRKIYRQRERLRERERDRKERKTSSNSTAATAAYALPSCRTASRYFHFSGFIFLYYGSVEVLFKLLKEAPALWIGKSFQGNPWKRINSLEAATPAVSAPRPMQLLLPDLWLHSRITHFIHVFSNSY